MANSIAGTERIAADARKLAQLAAAWLTETLAGLSGDIRIALSGGSTPRELYRLLGEDKTRMPWDRLQLYWGDERFVPHDDAESNYRMVRESLLAHAPMSGARIHPIPVDGTLRDAAERYEAELKQAYGATTLSAARPLFDVILLGLGEDGHTCSLLPGQPVLEERRRWVAAVPSGRNEPRITLTYPAVNASRYTVFLVSGASKASAVKRVRDGDLALPAARIEPSGEVFWFIDAAAAGNDGRRHAAA